MSKRALRMVAVAIGLAAGLFVTLWGGEELLASVRLAWGKTATAQVMDVQERVSASSRQHSYYLVVAFQTANRSLITKNVLVSKEVFTAAQRKGTVKIHYLAAEPGTCVAGTNVELRYGNFVLGLLVLSIAAFLAMKLKRLDSKTSISPASDQSPSAAGSEPAQSQPTASQPKENGLRQNAETVPAQTPSLAASNPDCGSAGCPSQGVTFEGLAKFDFGTEALGQGRDS